MTREEASLAESPSAGPNTPSLVEAHGLLCELERRYDLLRYRAGGWAAWPLLRFEVSVSVAGVTCPGALVAGRADRLRRAVSDVPALLTAQPARHLVKTYSSGLAEQIGNQYWDIWFDDVVAVAGSTFKIETPNNPRFLERSARARTPRNVWSCSIDALAWALARRQPGPDVIDAAAGISHALQDGLGRREFDGPWVLDRLRHFVSSKRVYRALLRRVRPAYVLTNECTEYALVAAAKEHGACAMELQHGVSDRTHAGYGWTDYAVPYRASMPMPDRLLLYGEHWKRELDVGGFWGDSLRVVGCPRVDRYRQVTTARPQDRTVVLFTTQGLDTGRVTSFLRQFLESVQGRVPVRLVIKLHPQHDCDPQVYLETLTPFRESVAVIPGNEAPSTFELLSGSHLHISIASATHYDAIGLGVPTIILPFQTHEVALPLSYAGHANLARTPADLAALVVRARELVLPAGVSEYYFRSNAVSNTLKELGLDKPGE